MVFAAASLIPYASSHASCAVAGAAVAPPGFFQMADGSVSACAADSFSANYTAAGVACTLCAAVGRQNFTAAAAGATSPSDGISKCHSLQAVPCRVRVCTQSASRVAAG
jgi:hypothetical protein